MITIIATAASQYRTPNIDNHGEKKELIYSKKKIIWIKKCVIALILNFFQFTSNGENENFDFIHSFSFFLFSFLSFHNVHIRVTASGQAKAYTCMEEICDFFTPRHSFSLTLSEVYDYATMSYVC